MYDYSMADFKDKAYIFNNCFSKLLLTITHNTFTVFDANPSLEVRGFFLDLSKAFDIS